MGAETSQSLLRGRRNCHGCLPQLPHCAVRVYLQWDEVQQDDLELQTAHEKHSCMLIPCPPSAHIAALICKRSPRSHVQKHLFSSTDMVKNGEEENFQFCSLMQWNCGSVGAL